MSELQQILNAHLHDVPEATRKTLERRLVQWIDGEIIGKTEYVDFDRYSTEPPESLSDIRRVTHGRNALRHEQRQKLLSTGHEYPNAAWRD